MAVPQNPLERVTLRNPIHFLALGFGSGLLRPGEPPTSPLFVHNV